VGRRSVGDAGEGQIEDRWIASRLNTLIEDVNRLAGDFQLGQAAARIYDFVWHEYADWYIEMAKVRVARGDRSPVPVLVETLATSLRLLHPYMPFVTEEIWQNLRPHLGAGASEALIAAPYPLAEGAGDAEAARQTETLIEVVRAARNLRAEKRLKPGEFMPAFVVAPDAGVRAALADRAELIEALARLRPLAITADEGEAPREGVAKAVLAEATLAIQLPGVDLEAERARLRAEIDQVEAYLARQGEQLAKAKASGRAPERVISEMEEKLAAARTRLEGLRRGLEELLR